mgnify:CR=1 FL=1
MLDIPAANPTLGFMRRSIDQALKLQTVGQVLARKALSAHYQPIVQLKDGKVVEQGATEVIFDNPIETYTKALMAAAFDMEFDEKAVAEGVVRM